jgi:hypothetical protein
MSCEPYPGMVVWCPDDSPFHLSTLIENFPDPAGAGSFWSWLSRDGRVVDDWDSVIYDDWIRDWCRDASKVLVNREEGEVE